ncbi:MAG TPA: hypothetical protein VGR66_08455 [Candidatus Eisenbacteria bacterium]|nr:hypothetical protein [Candidatus Eisenbacteria bacterium]
MPIREVISVLEARLSRGLSHYRFRLLAGGLVRALVIGAAAVLAALALGAVLLRVPGAFLPLTAGLVVTLLAVVARYVVWPLLGAPDLRRFARQAEDRLPELRSLLVNALELAPIADGTRRAPGDTSPELAAALLAQAERRSRESDFQGLAPEALPHGWGRPLIVVAALWIVAWVVAPEPLSRAGFGLLHPRAAAAAAISIDVRPGDITLAPGASLDVQALVQGSTVTPSLSFVSLGHERRVRMRPAGEARAWTALVEGVSAPGTYRVLLGPVSSRSYRVSLSGEAAPVSFEITYRYPAYTHLPAETQSATRADLTALAGTRATVVINLDRAVSAASWTLGSELHQDGDRRWVGETVLSGDRDYDLVITDGGRQDRQRYHVQTIADRAPILALSAPAGDMDLPSGGKVPIAASGADDFGLTDLSLAYETASGAKGRVSLARWPAEPKDAQVQADWDAGDLGLLPGQSATFWLELRDNDRVGGPHVTTSAHFAIRFPTLSEVYKQIDDKQADATDKMQKALDDMRELAKQTDELKRDAAQTPLNRQGQSSNGWDKRQTAKEAADRQQEIADKMQQVADQIQESARQGAENQAFQQEMLSKMNEIANLVRQLDSPELKEAIQKLQQSMQQVDPRRMEASLQKLQQSQEEMMKGLERTLELLKKVRQEEQLQSAARRAEELAKRQEALAKQSQGDKKADADERERLAKSQEQAQKETEELKKELDALQKQLQESAMQKPSEQTQQAAQKLEQATPQQQQAASQMRQGQQQQSAQSSQSAQQNLQAAAQQLQQAANSMSDESQRQIAESVRRSAQDLVDLSKAQEDMLGKQANADQRAQQQQDLREGAEHVADDLMDLAKRTPFMPPEASKALGQALQHMKNSEQAFSQNGEQEGQSEGEQASGQLNVAVIALKQAQASMCQGNSPGGPKPNANGREQMQSLSGQQNDLNQDTQSLVQRLTQQERLAAGDQASLEQLAARQEAIRRGLEEAQKAAQEGDLLGRLDDAKRDMDEVAKQLQQGRIDPDLTERQNKILSRLLDAQRSVNRREFDDQRESRSGDDVTRPSPPPLARDLLQPKDRAERDLLRARAERYPAEYRDLVEAYLRKLQESR